jgi:hypothetical protein
MPNLELVEKVKAYLREKPLRLNMGDWVARYEGPKEFEPPCKTVCCVAGAVVIVAGVVKDWLEYANNSGCVAANDAQRLLGISQSDADKLFYTQHWPRDLGRQYDNLWEIKDRVKRKKMEVELACQAIDYVIAHPEPDADVIKQVVDSLDAEE